MKIIYKKCQKEHIKVHRMYTLVTTRRSQKKRELQTTTLSPCEHPTNQQKPPPTLETTIKFRKILFTSLKVSNLS